LNSNVSALGSIKNTIEQKLDGTFVKTSGNETLRSVAIAEQTIREYFSGDYALDLNRVEYVPINQRKMMLAHVSGFRRLAAEEIDRLETDIRQTTGDSAIELVIIYSEKSISSANGTTRYGWILGKEGTPANIERVREIHADLVSFFDHDEEYQLVNTNVTRLDDKFHFLLEITGPEVYPRQHIEALKAQLANKFKEPIALYTWSRIEVIHGPQGLQSMKELNEYYGGRQKENLTEKIPLIL
jgi:hypothetical protein